MKAVTRSSLTWPTRIPVIQPEWLFGFDSESMAYSMSLSSMKSPLIRLNW